ncbi:hypothetical protein DCAR_0728891 [Daucus carota subsp. sativus]|uniref:Uncharacterized protein n=2 Tax=Daucus carota subsp. sativus TaxID=79200 RepID=A0AAF0XLY8_DAUCS|nr:hypothetical protein DCAR_0728891 [Daucus carota subsp. sativus]
MADAIVADLASGLVCKLVALATEEVIQAWKLHQDLETLRERLESIDALLSDANNKKPTMSAVQNWFNKLEAVARVADVFMDELAYEVTRHKVEKHHKVRNFFIPSKNTLLYRFKVARKIKSIDTSFDKYFKWALDLGLQPVAHLGSIVQRREIRRTPPFEDESKIVGRDDDISYLVQTLCKNHEEDLPVIAIVGMGGQGKTTLARMVYNRDVVIDMFPKRMWITVSNDFDFMKILNEMIVSLTSVNSVLGNTEGLIKDLQKNLKGEKFLLVLDDIWNEEPEEWDNLMNSLIGVQGMKGSSIMVTTRSQEVVDALRCSLSYQVEKLTDEDSWTLFKQRAFSRGGVSETGAFAALGRRMVEKCGGLPLAIKTLGGLLHSKKSEEEWLLIQNSEIWKSEGVLSSLRLSYDNLPYSSLKRCFAYCSIIPKDSHIYKDELVHIWMALGFLLPPKGSNALMEDVGNEYFNILLWNSLLQDVERDDYGNITYCKMHDLVHDLALDVSANYYANITPSHGFNQVSKAIYARLEGFKAVNQEISSVYFNSIQALYAQASVLSVVLPNLKQLRVLVLNSHYKELPSSMGNMKFLKHLDILSSVRFKSYKLPNYITKLYNLQTLRIWALNELPEKVCNLINLRHLVVQKKYAEELSTRYMFIGIQRLTCLQTLPHFVVSRKRNCLLSQLEGLNLGGTLDLYGLSDVSNMEEASKAKLCEKSNIQCLLLDWSNNEDEREGKEYNDEDVIEGLRPHTYLKELSVVSFKGRKFASWITMMMNLVKITLKDCNNCDAFPPLSHLPKLREILIFGMHNVKVIGRDFCGGLASTSSGLSDSGSVKTVATMYPSLTTLVLQGLSNLEEWLEPNISTGDEGQNMVPVFPKLEVLKIERCSKLRMIPNTLFLFSKLRELVITNLDSSEILETMSRKISSLVNLRLRSIRDRNGGSSSNVYYLIEELLKTNSLSLKTLNLDNCPGLKFLTIGIVLEELEVSDCLNLTSINVVEGGLKHLIIGRCPSLSELVFVPSTRSRLEKMILGPFSEDLNEFPWPSFSSVFSFPKLTSLTLYGWKKVRSILLDGELDDRLSSTFPALTLLYINDFEGVKSLPESLAKLPSFERLRIWNCNNLKSLPVFHESHSLQYLKIFQCTILEERCRRESGPEWFKIQHIPRIQIGHELIWKH